MTVEAREGRERARDEIREAARDYFRDRDALESRRHVLLGMILRGAGHRLTQQEIAEACDLTAEDPKSDKDWKFHRTRIQQFLREARQAAGV